MEAAKAKLENDPGVRQGVQREADLELLRRLLVGFLVYVGMILSLGRATTLPHEHPGLYWGLLASVAVSLVLRGLVLLLRDRLLSRGRLWMMIPTVAATLIGSTALGISYVRVLDIYGFASWNFIMVTMWMVGIFSGSTISLTPNFPLLMTQLTLLLGPVLVASPFLLANGQSIEIGLWAFYGFHLYQGRRMSALYMQFLVDRACEAKRNEEFEAARQTAERAQKELRYRANYDFLTGLLNRGQILGLLDREFVRAGREKGALAVVMFDLDHFKQVNDLFGHQAGDKVLQSVARLVQDAIRPYDAVGRYGGEEFLIVLPGCDLEDAAASADRIRHQIAANPVEFGGQQVTITASFGVTTIDRDHDPAESQMIARADRALYSAKHRGRNRVEWRLAEEITAGTQPRF